MQAHAESGLLAFALVSLVMACTPGPNMMYLVSRSICQGTRAGLVSLIGVAAAFAVYMISSALGLTALLIAVPYAYDAIRWAGAAYLLWMAWQTVRPTGASPFQVRALPPDSARRLVAMGFATNMLNPKAAVLYLSLLPQFLAPETGDLLRRSLTLGATQIGISCAVNGLAILAAGAVARFLVRHPLWELLQRWTMGAVLSSLAVRMALDSRR